MGFGFGFGSSDFPRRSDVHEVPVIQPYPCGWEKVPIDHRPTNEDFLTSDLRNFAFPCLSRDSEEAKFVVEDEGFLMYLRALENE